MKLEISDKEIIELIVTLKERLDKIENKVDTIAAFLIDEINQQAPYANTKRQANTLDYNNMKEGIAEDEVSEAVTYMAMPTLENICLYDKIPFAFTQDGLNLIR